MITSITDGTLRKPIGAASVPVATPANAPSFGEALAKFEKEARMTSHERARRDILAGMRLTEDDVKAMSPADRKAIEEKIAPMIARRVAAIEEAARRAGKQPGLALL